MIPREYSLMNAKSVPFRAFAVMALAIALPACAKGPSVELKGQRFSIEIAETDAAREHGLMDRESMPQDHGMLFVFQDDQPRAFWMKNCKFPQDMLFFDADRKLISIQHDVPACTADPCPRYSSGAPARYVLELNAGQARKLGVAPGDEMQIQR
jgi:uncharacterized membrane protein (UPF0127 family)